MNAIMRVVALLLLLPLAFRPAQAGDVDATVRDRPTLIAEFSLTDQNGAGFTRDDLVGKWSLILLGYTHCPDICPFTLANLAAVRAELSGMAEPEKLPQFIFLSVDPDRDAPILADYVAYYDAAFVGITGRPEEIDSLVRSIDGFYKLHKKGDDDDAYEVTHNASVAIITPDSTMAATINPPFAPKATADYLLRLMNNAHMN